MYPIWNVYDYVIGTSQRTLIRFEKKKLLQIMSPTGWN